MKPDSADLEIQFVALGRAHITHAGAAFARGQGEQRGIFLLEEHVKRGPRRDCVEVTKDLAECETWVAFFEPVGCVARNAGANGRFRLLDASGDAQPREQFAEITALLEQLACGAGSLVDFHVRQIAL
jgi:hypothetical protein